MRCKNHFSDATSVIGVCSSCLRERLLFLIETQSESHRRHLTPAAEDRRNQLPPPLIFPRSVSPYISRRKSDAAMDADLSDQIRQRFFTSPQAIPTANKEKKKKSKFHAISKLFRSRSTKSAQSTLDPSSNPAENADGRRWGSRGMSPGVVNDDDSETEEWKRTPSSGSGLTRTSQARVKASPARSHVASGIGICLSPLLRPSPSRNWKGVGPTAEVAYSGEIRSTVKPHLVTAASLRKNRSRKLADFGRFNHNR